MCCVVSLSHALFLLHVLNSFEIQINHSRYLDGDEFEFCSNLCAGLSNLVFEAHFLLPSGIEKMFYSIILGCEANKKSTPSVIAP